MKKLLHSLAAVLVVMSSFSPLGIVPIADAATSSNLLATSQGNFTARGVNSGTKVLAVQSADGDTTYIDSTTNNETQTFRVDNAGIPAGSTINSVTLFVRAKGTGNGNGVKEFRLGIENGGDFNGSPKISVTNNYDTYSRVMATNPLTTSAWTLSEVNAWGTMRFGVKRANGNDSIRVTHMYVVVDYTAPVCGDGTINQESEVCDDGNQNNTDGCKNDCTFSCTVDADCTDDTVCNGTETCNTTTHICEAGTPLTVDDGLFCTTDSCDPREGVSHVAILVDDGFFCTVDSCDEEIDSIVHTSINVDDENTCTVDSCNEETDTVENTTIDTDEDGIADCIDNCPEDPNPDQVDIDNDTFGDVCDKPECGNGYPEGEEECDGVENCTDTCTWYVPSCGNAILDEGEECDGEENCTETCTWLEEEKPCATLTLNIKGKKPRMILLSDLPKTLSYSQNRKVTISSVGGDTYKLVYDVNPNPKKAVALEGSLVINGSATYTNLDLSAGTLEAGDSATQANPTKIKFDMSVKPSTDTFEFTIGYTDGDEDGVSDCTDLCPQEGGNVDETGCQVICDPTDEICDGVDNDCDDKIDEDLDVVMDCSAGEGACFTEGTSTDTCVDGVIVEGECTAIAGEPTEEVCDKIDNDCDGDVNEDLMCEPEICTDVAGPFVYEVPATTSTTTPLDAGTVNEGDVLTISADSVDIWSAGPNDPETTNREGNANGLDTFPVHAVGDDSFKFGALVGRISGGEWFLVGTTFTTTVTEAGTLELAYRDSEWEDNSGEIEVTINREYVVECPYVPVCDNGILDEGEDERCDGDSMMYETRIDSRGYCNESCQWVEEEGYCGDGIVDRELGEECDEGELVSRRIKSISEETTYCNDSCKLVAYPTCGDGIVNNEGEQCDDGNKDNNDNCSNECTTNAPIAPTGGGQASSVGGSTPAGPQTLLETGPEGNVPTEATAETVISACEEDTYILERLGKLKKLSMEIVEVIPSKYARKIGTKAIKLMNQLSSMLRKTTDKEVKNDHIRALVCKIEIMKEARGLRHKNIGAQSNGNEVDYLLQYLQDLAILQFKK